MKILRVIPTMNPIMGGPSQGIRNSIPALLVNGVFNEVVCFDDPNSDFLERDSFKTYALGEFSTGWKYNSKFLDWLLLNLQNYDVVIVHGLWLYHAYAVTKAIKTLKSQNSTVPKVFIMPHGMLDPYFQNTKDRKLKAVRNLLYWSLIEKNNINSCDGLLFTSELEMEGARTTFTSYFPKREINIGYGISRPPQRSESNANELFSEFQYFKKPYILFLSRIHEKKGVDILIEAFGKILMKNTNIPNLIIAGPGLDSEYGRKIQEMAKPHGNKIFFPGMLEGSNKWEAYYNCEAFILPSHQENFGIAVAEALACKAPVLITNKVNIWKEISDNKAGFVTDDTLEGIESLLHFWLALDNDSKYKLKLNAYGTFVNNFETNTVIKKLIDVVSSN